MNPLYERSVSLIQHKELHKLSDEELERLVNELVKVSESSRTAILTVSEGGIPPKVVFDTLLYERAKRMWGKSSS